MPFDRLKRLFAGLFAPPPAPGPLPDEPPDGPAAVPPAAYWPPDNAGRVRRLADLYARLASLGHRDFLALHDVTRSLAATLRGPEHDAEFESAPLRQRPDRLAAHLVFVHALAADFAAVADAFEGERAARAAPDPAPEP